MTSAEFSEWGAFEALEGPLSLERTVDYPYALLASILVNVNRDPKKSKQAKPEDFIPDWEQMSGVPKEEKTPEQVADVGKSWLRRLKAKARS